MSARVTVNVHVDADTVVEQVVFPHAASGPFVAVQVGVGGDQKVSIMATDPDALVALADTIAAAHADLTAALADRATTDPATTGRVGQVA